MRGSSSGSVPVRVIETLTCSKAWTLVCSSAEGAVFNFFLFKEKTGEITNTNKKINNRNNKAC